MFEEFETGTFLRQKIKQAARTLFNSKGVDQTSIDDITAMLKISEEVIRQHFRSIDDVLEAVWSES